MQIPIKYKRLLISLILLVSFRPLFALSQEGTNHGDYQIYSSLSSVNSYAFNTPGLMLLSVYQGFTLTGSILQFLELPAWFNSASNHPGTPVTNKSLVIDSWAKYLSITRELTYGNTISQGDDSGYTKISLFQNYFPESSKITSAERALFGNSGGGTNSVSSTPSLESAPTIVVTHGVCGAVSGTIQTALTETGGNLCSLGTVGSFSGTGPWNWSCIGNNSGTTMNCSADKLVSSGTLENSGTLFPLPTLTLSGTPTLVTYSSSSDITWSSSGTTTCTTPWGSTSTGGTYTTPSLFTGTTYTISCSGSGGTVSGSLNIDVDPLPPVPTISITGSTLMVLNESGSFTFSSNITLTGSVNITLMSSGTILGTLTPSTVELNTGNPSSTFSFTATATGQQTIIFSNDAGFVNPEPLYIEVVTPSEVPASIVIEDWSSGTGVPAGSLSMDTLIRRDTFIDPALALDCVGWSEFGPAQTSILPVLGGIQFGAKLFTIDAGGQYTRESHRVLIMMRAIGLRDGLYGDPRGVPTFPPAHKIRILNASGVTIKTIQMRDGLPMNHSSLINVPFSPTLQLYRDPFVNNAFPQVSVSYTPALPRDKAMRPWVSAGSSYIAFFGDTPDSSLAVRDKIPRVKYDNWPNKSTNARATYNGDDFHLYDPDFGGNGNAHPEVMREWAMSKNEAIQTNPPYLYGGGANWINALRVGWGYEPGALGGITRRGGPGGVRMDRTVLPQEIFQMYLSQTGRLWDGQPTSPMARGFALNHANYPGYYPKDMYSLDAIDQFDPTPQPTVNGGSSTAVLQYYGTLTNYANNTGAIWILDDYGGAVQAIAGVLEWSKSGSHIGNGMHPRNGWSPDSEHANRDGTAWATLLYSDPLFARMAENMMMFETNLITKNLSNGTWNQGTSAALHIADAGAGYWNSRTNILPLPIATMMWWIATENGVYKRSEIEGKFHTFFAKWKTDIRDNFPATNLATTPSQRAFELTGGMKVVWGSWKESDGNFDTGSGWVIDYPLAKVYLGQFMMLLKTSGLYDVLSQNPTTNVVLNDFLKQQELHARVFADAPWAVSTLTVGGSPQIVLRRASQGAIQADLTTIPSTVAEVIGYSPAFRSDAYWFLKGSATPGVDTYTLNTNYAGLARIQAAKAWWDFYAPRGAERDTARAKINGYMQTAKDYTPAISSPGFTRFNSPQIIPALD